MATDAATKQELSDADEERDGGKAEFDGVVVGFLVYQRVYGACRYEGEGEAPDVERDFLQGSQAAVDGGCKAAHEPCEEEGEDEYGDYAAANVEEGFEEGHLSVRAYKGEDGGGSKGDGDVAKELVGGDEGYVAAQHACDNYSGGCRGDKDADKCALCDKGIEGTDSGVNGYGACELDEEEPEVGGSDVYVMRGEFAEGKKEHGEDEERSEEYKGAQERVSGDSGQHGKGKHPSFYEFVHVVCFGIDYADYAVFMTINIY